MRRDDGAEITPVEPDLVRTSEGSESHGGHATLGNRAGAGAPACPRSHRYVLLWTNLGISLLVLVLPAYFDLSLRDALAATLVGALIGNPMLAVAALIGADARVPTMVLQRAPLGRRGSYLPTGLNVLQCLGWAIFELIVIATAAAAALRRAFGFKASGSGSSSSASWPRCSRCSAPSDSCGVRAQVRDLGRARLGDLSRLVDPGRRHVPTHLVGEAGTTDRSGSRSTRSSRSPSRGRRSSPTTRASRATAAARSSASASATCCRRCSSSASAPSSSCRATSTRIVPS